MKSEVLVYNEFQRLYEKCGSYRAMAQEMDLSIGYLHDVMEGRRPIAGKLAERMGYKVHVERIIERAYEPINTTQLSVENDEI